ncbi:MAG: GH92 family glycosyl hydrolase [Bacteroidetes bacterium]|nr:GH92 family glycosyl hydrolase [Bacteroidota bacterium]
MLLHQGKSLSMYRILPVFIAFFSVLSAQIPLTRVNPFIGTGGHGHTYPGATAPFGMVQLSPDTRLDGWDGCSGYHFDDSICYGFSHTHLSGTGVSDYGDLLIRPALNPLSFSHRNEQAVPGYYAVQFDNGIFAEMTAGLRNGIHHYRFPASVPKLIVVDLAHRDYVVSGNMNISLSDPTNSGAATIAGHRFSKAWAEDQQFFFFGQFSIPADSFRLIETVKGEYRRVVLYFPPATRDLYLEVNVSFSGWLSPDKLPAKQISEARFRQVRHATRLEWEQQLSKIRVAGNPEQETIFYTALYHTMIVPNRVDDADGSYRGMDRKQRQSKGPHYSVFSLWDTHRAAHPLYTLIEQQRTREFLNSFLRMYRESGRLPVWELASNETNCMIGYHAVSVIADAMAKDILPDSANALFKDAVASAEKPVFGIDDYKKYGFLSIENESESVSKTLEYAYDDWCVARMAEMLGNDSLRRVFDVRSAAWQNLLDPETLLMRPRSNGGRYELFEPREVNNHYTEANSWQYSFSVQHDLHGWMQQLQTSGGDAEALLDSLFSASSATVGREQVDITGLIGQYAHGNEPSHHIAYLYNSVGAPAKTQERVKQILDKLYHAAPDGLSGNEDCGQMSAWYVLSSLGFYPVCPGDARYSIGYPLFRKAEVNFEDGRRLRMQKRGTGNYIRDLKLNGRSISRNYLSHAALTGGGKLVFYMGTTPGSWGTNPEDCFLTEAHERVLPAPVWQAPDQAFNDSTVLLLQAAAHLPLRLERNGHWWMDTILPASAGGTLQLKIREDACITAQHLPSKAYSGAAKSRTSVFRRPNNWQVRLLNPMNRQYTAGGAQALTDGITGDAEWQKGRWMGIQEQPFVAEIDLGTLQTLSHAELGFLQDTRSWIVFPKGLRLFFSEDGMTWQHAQFWTNPIPVDSMTSMRQSARLDFPPISARFVRIEAEQFGPLPAWHPGAGGQSFIFTDEVRFW